MKIIDSTDIPIEDLYKYMSMKIVQFSTIQGEPDEMGLATLHMIKSIDIDCPVEKMEKDDE